MVRDTQAETPRPALLGELFSFAAVGGTAALAFVALSTLLTGLPTGLPDWLVSALCYALFIVPVYLAHRRLSFHSEVPHAVALPRYVAVQMSALALASLFSYVCYGLFGLSSAVAATLVICLTSGVNFVVLKLWAFAQRS
jgi:putative flippase GtrA